MNFRLLLLLVLALCAERSTAQYVNIPDPDFAFWLQNNGYASCFNGNQLDTTCPAVINATNISFTNISTITDITGIQYFDNLDTLSVPTNGLLTLPQLPPLLTYLRCSNNNYLNNLSPLPATLKTFWCSNVSTISVLDSLPDLPPGLEVLRCNGNQLTSLPALPSTLIRLDCYENDLTALPDLPAALNRLNCADNQITSLPALPDSLERLFCSFNLLTSLPALPEGLEVLSCFTNDIAALPTLPNSLTALVCNWNFSLPSIPALPSGLRELYCAGTAITELPVLPDTLYMLEAHNNPQLTCLPELDVFLPIYSSSVFDISNTGITCLPNAIAHPGFIAAIDTMPICAPGDPCYLGVPCESAVANVDTTNLSSTSITVTWDASPSAVKYRVRVKNLNTGALVLYFVTAPTTLKIVNGLSPNTSYQIKVRSQCSTNGSVLSPWSAPVLFTTPGTVTPNCLPPTNVVVTPGSTTASVSWTPVSGANGHQLRYRETGTTNWTLVILGNPAITDTTLSGLLPNTSYDLQMRTKCTVNPKTWSNYTTVPLATQLRIEEQQNAAITIYPNPAANDVTIKLGSQTNALVEVTDLTGKILFTVATEKVETRLSLENFSSGTYFVRITENDRVIGMKKLTVMR